MYSITCTLTPTHLRKAKLMFFFTRYPSSALLRQHFPDVKFNRHNTSQIIKWFSNFREFYYIQMEKFARQSVSDNVEIAEDLKVTRDSELYRSLNLHYNKSNEFTVSPFLCVWVGFETYSYLRTFLSFLYQSLLLFNSLWLSMFVTILFFFYILLQSQETLSKFCENFPEIECILKMVYHCVPLPSSCEFLFCLFPCLSLCLDKLHLYKWRHKGTR